MRWKLQVVHQRRTDTKVGPTAGSRPCANQLELSRKLACASSRRFAPATGSRHDERQELGSVLDDFGDLRLLVLGGKLRVTVARAGVVLDVLPLVLGKAHAHQRGRQELIVQ